jgi:hypothetical protein
MPLPKGQVRAYTDGLVYWVKDVEWICVPTEDDPGVLRPKDGAIPVDDEQTDDCDAHDEL